MPKRRLYQRGMRRELEQGHSYQVAGRMNDSADLDAHSLLYHAPGVWPLVLRKLHDFQPEAEVLVGLRLGTSISGLAYTTYRRHQYRPPLFHNQYLASMFAR